MSQSPMFMIIMMVAIFAIPYFLISKPQKKREEQRRAAINALEQGDLVSTRGGFIGAIDTYDELSNTYIIELHPDGTKVRVRKEAIAGAYSEPEPYEEDEEAEYEDEEALLEESDECEEIIEEEEEVTE